MNKVIIFDLDGPVLDCKIKHYTVYTKVINKLNGVTLPIETYWRLKRKKTPIKQILKLSNINESNESLFLQDFISLIETKKYLELDELQLEVVSTLQQLIRKGYKLILITSRCNRENLLWQLKKLHLNTCFNHILSPITNTDTKYSLAQQGITNGKCICVVGDTEEDETLAGKLSVPFFAVTTGIRDKELLHASAYFDSIADIENLLE